MKIEEIVLPNNPIYNAKGNYRDKPTIGIMLGQGIKDNKIETPIQVEYYQSNKGSIVYCNIWIDNKYSGNGKAGGYGYHKQSAAFQDAMESMGIEMPDISGAGTEKTKEVLKHILVLLGYENATINILTNGYC